MDMKGDRRARVDQSELLEELKLPAPARGTADIENELDEAIQVASSRVREDLIDRPAGRWNIYKHLPPSRLQKLSNADLAVINNTFDRIQDYIEEARLDFIPVFGYLSLPTKNFAELGKKSQDEVRNGEDVVAATLPNFGIDVVMSTVFRGRPEWPGLVGGLRPSADKSTEGVVLKVPVDRAEELVPVLLQREFFAESDLVDSQSSENGPTRSNAMYAPEVCSVRIDEKNGVTNLNGDSLQEIEAIVFVSNPVGGKSITLNPPYHDGQVTVERLAYIFAAEGGFVEADGTEKGGNTIEYWEKYRRNPVVAKQLAGSIFAEAMELSKLWPKGLLAERLEDSSRQDEYTVKLRNAVGYLFDGASTPTLLKMLQKPRETDDIAVRLTGKTPVGTEDGDIILTAAIEKAVRENNKEMLNILL